MIILWVRLGEGSKDLNSLEHYLVEVIKIEPFTNKDWSNEPWAKGKEFILVTAKFNCYGNISTDTSVYSTTEWQEIVDRGYYIG